MKEGSENGGIGRENAEFQRLLAGAKCVQVKERVALKSHLARLTPPGKAVREFLLPPRKVCF